MQAKITCPNCEVEIEITEVMRAQLTEQIRGELEVETTIERARLADATKALEQKRAEVDAAKRSIDAQIAAAVASRHKAIYAEAKAKAIEDLAVELRDGDERVAELDQKLKEAQANELELRKRERDIKAKVEELELDVARRLEAERDGIRADARRQFEEQQQLVDAEKDKRIQDLRKQIDELKRKVEQGSQQLQGEVQEIAIESYLRRSFPTDSLAPVAKGVEGADVLQIVCDRAGSDCGRILWESKRTKNWSDGWLTKARDNQRDAKAAYAVIVSQALPKDVNTFALIDGVWACSWSCLPAPAAVLRVGMIEVGKTKRAIQGQHEKTEVVYNYLVSREFQHRVGGVIEAFLAIQTDLEKERRSLTRLWAKRKQHLERALFNTAGLYGDLQAIVGSSLPEVAGLSLPLIELKEEPVGSGSKL